MKRKNKVSLYVAKYDGDRGALKAPLLGAYVPDGWAFTKSFLVHKSANKGFNEETPDVKGFLKEVKKGYGYGIIFSDKSKSYYGVYIRRDDDYAVLW